MDDQNLYSLTKECAKLQNLYDKQQLERQLMAQMQLLNSMSDSLAVLEEIVSLPKTFCDIMVQKEQPFLEIDRKSGACLRNIKENVVEIFKNNLNDANEITFPQHLESSIEKLTMELQEKREKNKILSCLLNNILAVSHSKISSDETINIDDLSCIKTDSDGINAQDLFPESLNDVDESNETIKKL